MRLTYHTDYALRVLLYLAVSPTTQRAHIQDIADAYAISSNHLMKIVHQLGKLGYIETIRGRNGGMRLARNPAAICIGEWYDRPRKIFSW